MDRRQLLKGLVASFVAKGVEPFDLLQEVEDQVLELIPEHFGPPNSEYIVRTNVWSWELKNKLMRELDAELDAMKYIKIEE